MALIHIKKGDIQYFIKVLHERNNKLWYFPDTGLMCTHDGVLVNADEWLQKKLNWGNVHHAPRLVLKALKAI
jgi:hypothetical protein